MSPAVVESKAEEEVVAVLLTHHAGLLLSVGLMLLLGS